MNSGDFARAADAFDDVAEGARSRGMPVRAAHLALQASRAHFAAGNIARAVQQAKAGLLALIAAGRATQAGRLLPRILEAFGERGFSQEADEVEAAVEQAFDQAGVSPDERAESHAPDSWPQVTLPARCPGCGASLVRDEVEWHDRSTARCAYCGCTVTAA